MLLRQGFAFAPLQDAGILQRLSLTEIPDEMKLMLADGRILGGAQAVALLAASVPWSRPLSYGMRLQPVMALVDRCYRWVAAHRGCTPSACHVHGVAVHPWRTR
jgi:predicted DCC family thiol-disulfide oxidoreductase YuxK